LSGILHDHINTVVSRYAGQIYAWDVINEAFNDNGTLRSTIWLDSPGIGLPGTAYMEQALQWTHQAAPQALLLYTDYSAELANATAADLAAQAQVYHDVFALCLKFPLCTSIQSWGFTDKYSWIPGAFPGRGAALEFDTAYQPKPAYNSIQTALQSSPPVISAA